MVQTYIFLSIDLLFSPPYTMRDASVRACRGLLLKNQSEFTQWNIPRRHCLGRWRCLGPGAGRQRLMNGGEDHVHAELKEPTFTPAPWRSPDPAAAQRRVKRKGAERKHKKFACQGEDKRLPRLYHCIWVGVRTLTWKFKQNQLHAAS